MNDLKIAEQCIPKECKDDLVSRRQVYCLKLASECDLEFGRALIDMPSAEPESETGIWIWKTYVWWCSECGKNPTKGTGYVQKAEELFDYCPHCGARMEGVQI